MQRIIFGIAALAAAAVPGLAQSQALEEVVVTAQRREQSLQDVPIAITAFSGDTLQRNNLTSARDYLAITPGVSFTDDGQSGARSIGIAIRGVTNLVTGENAFTNSIGIYLDEFSIASVPNGVANPFLPDMARVEVLRGPQGTYFGRNAVGGALNLTTNDPTENFGARLIVGGESYESANEMFNVTGIINLPVSEQFGLRGVVRYEDSGGLVDNICRSGATAIDCPLAGVNGFTPNGSDDSGHEWLDIRLKGLWTPTDRTTIKGTFIYSDMDQGTDENVPSGVLDLDTVDTLGLTAAVDPGTGFWPNNRDLLSHDLNERNQMETFIGILNIAHEVNENLTVKWISGFIDAEQERRFDNDLLGGFDALQRDNAYDGFSWSTELRLEYITEQYDLVGGFMYAEDTQDQSNDVAVSTQPTATATDINGNVIGVLPPFPEGLGLALNEKEYELESIAVFGDFTWHWNERWDTFIGLRFTHDKVRNFIQSFGLAPGTAIPGPPGFINFPRGGSEASRKFDDISGRVGFTFRATDEWTLYGTFSKGYKNGGTSVGDVFPNTAVPFDEENLWNIEGGFKAALLDGRLRWNASVFHLVWKDLQLEAFRFLIPGDLSSNFEQTINVDEATGTGFETDFAFAVTDRFTVSGGLGYIDTEIEDAPLATLTGGFIVQLEGLELPRAPELTANIAGEYRFPLAANEAWLRVEYLHRDGQYSDIEALTNQQTTGPSPNSGLARPLVGEFPYRTPDFDVVNLRAGYDMGPWAFTLYVQNLLDEEYYTGTQENFGASGMRLRPNPRFFGATVSYTFGDL